MLKHGHEMWHCAEHNWYYTPGGACVQCAIENGEANDAISADNEAVEAEEVHSLRRDNGAVRHVVLDVPRHDVSAVRSAEVPVRDGAQRSRETADNGG